MKACGGLSFVRRLCWLVTICYSTHGFSDDCSEPAFVHLDLRPLSFHYNSFQPMCMMYFQCARSGRSVVIQLLTLLMSQFHILQYSHYSYLYLDDNLEDFVLWMIIGQMQHNWKRYESHRDTVIIIWEPHTKVIEIDVQYITFCNLLVMFPGWNLQYFS